MEVKYLISQIIVVLAMLCMASSYIVKKQSIILLLGIVGLSLYGAQYMLLDAYTGAFTSAISMVRNVWWFLLAYYKKENKWWNMALFFVLLIAVGALTCNSWYGIFAIIPALIYTYVVWQKNIIIYRWLSVLVSICYITYNALYHSIMGVICESIILCAEIIGIILLYTIQKKHLQKDITESPTQDKVLPTE